MNSAGMRGPGRRVGYAAAGFFMATLPAFGQERAETEQRIAIAAANMQDAVVVDCQLPGKLRKLGGTRTYLTPGRVTRTAAIVCRTRGGEYTLGDLAGGTLSLKRWLAPATEGDVEAQYYVARIYANGMDDVQVDYAQAALWYQRAADQGNKEAKQELGYLYEQGLGVEKDLLRALNLQREASGLGEELDYAWKIAEAERLQQDLAQQLEAANVSLQRSRLDLRGLQQSLSAAREDISKRESAMAGLLADLASARRQAEGAGDPQQLARLEAELDAAKAELARGQQQIAGLERERDAARTDLDARLLGGQAASLELKELLAVSRAEADTLRAQLANEQQRLIQSEEELRALRDEYRDQTDRLAAERERMLSARSRSQSDAAAYLAAGEAEVASQAARVAGLQSELQQMRSSLSEARSDKEALQRQIAAMQARFDAERTSLEDAQKALENAFGSGQAELGAMFAESQRELAAKEDALAAQRRQIESLQARSDSLRGRVTDLEALRQQEAEATGIAVGTLKAELGESRKEALALASSLEAAQAEKSALQANLARFRLDLQNQEEQGDGASREQVELLQAQIAAGESTIKVQNLRISALEEQIRARDVELAGLRERGDEPIPPAVRDAMAVLDMARSPGGSTLGRYYALLIANEEYAHMPSLASPVNDVTELQQLLRSRYGFDVEMLVNATQDDIMMALHRYSNELTETDNLLIYYAGRGSTPDGPPDRAYWLGVDADPDLRTGWLLSEHVSEKIKEMAAKRVLVVTDSCFSRQRVGSASYSVGRGLNPERFGILSALPARLVLTSGANVPIMDEGGDKTHSMFAHNFIEVLRQNENVLSGEMLTHEMVFRLREGVENPDRVTPVYQPLLGAGHGNGDFFFVPAMDTTLVAYAGAP
jgi:predicted  nucleic acid-binding Zn-ribbon protein